MDYKALYDEKRSMVLAELNAALAGVDAGQVGALIDALESAEKVFFVGVGRVMLSLQAIAKRLKQRIPAEYIHYVLAVVWMHRPFLRLVDQAGVVLHLLNAQQIGPAGGDPQDFILRKIGFISIDRI